MLTATSAALYKELVERGGKAEFSGKYDTLHFSEFPTPPQSLNLVIDFLAVGEVDGTLSLRVRLWDEVMDEGGPFKLQLSNDGSVKKFQYICGIPDLMFYGPGVYMIDVVFNGAALRSIPLSIMRLSPGQ